MYVPGIILGTFYVLIHVIITVIPLVRHYFYSHFIDEETKAQGG